MQLLFFAPKINFVKNSIERYVEFEILVIWKVWEFQRAIFAKRQGILAIFFLIFCEIDILLILVQFGSDRLGYLESAKNRQMGSHGLNWKIFIKSKTKFETFDKNNPRK